MKSRDIIIGFIVLVVLIAAVFWIRGARNKKAISLPSATPNISDKIGKTFNFQLPDGVEKAELRDVSGGNGSGVATRDAVLADLPDPAAGKYYQVFADGKFLGTMRIAKGGWIFDGKISGKKVEIRLGNTVILEGSF